MRLPLTPGKEYNIVVNGDGEVMVVRTSRRGVLPSRLVLRLDMLWEVTFGREHEVGLMTGEVIAALRSRREARYVLMSCDESLLPPERLIAYGVVPVQLRA